MAAGAVTREFFTLRLAVEDRPQRLDRRNYFNAAIIIGGDANLEAATPPMASLIFHETLMVLSRVKRQCAPCHI